MKLLNNLIFLCVFLLSVVIVFNSAVHGQNETTTVAPTTTAATPSPPSPPPNNNNNNNNPPPCTDALIDYEFGQCILSTNKMMALPYYTETCQKTSAMTTTVNPPKEVSCESTCSAGHYLSPKSNACEKCKAGSYSSGTLVHFPSDQASREGAVMWSSRCAPDPCEKWQMLSFAGSQSATFHSGNQSIGHRTSNPYNSYYADPSTSQEDESVISVLTLMVNIKDRENKGSIRFSYRTESEKYFDGLSIFVNGSVLTNPESAFTGGSWSSSDKQKSFQTTEQNAPFWMTGVWDTYQPGIIFLPYGTSEIRFIYRKDKNQAPGSDFSDFGLDRAFLTNFVIEGAQIGSTRCSRCPPGTFSKEGAASCTSCPRDTFSKDAGSDQCDPCPKNHYALPGSSQCTELPACTISDYVASYGGCDPKTGKQTQSWLLPPDALCVPFEEKNLPEDLKPQEMECHRCPFGGYRDAKTQQCKFCKPGYAESPDGKSECVPCAAGSYGQPSARFDHGFESIASPGTESIQQSIFSTECEGECADCTTEGGDGNSITNNDKCPNAFVLTSLQHADSDRTYVAIRSNTRNGDDYHSHLAYKFNTTNTDQGAIISLTYFFAYQDVSPPDELSILDPELRAYAFVYDKNTWGNSQPLLMTPTGRPGERTLRIVAEPSSLEQTFELHLHRNSISRSLDKRLTLYITRFSVDGDSRGSANKCITCPAGHYCTGTSPVPISCPIGTHAPVEGVAQCMACTGNTVATMKGFKTCDECYPGSTANKDHTWCDQDCRVNLPDGHGIFDFTIAKNQVFGPVPEWTSGSSPSVLDQWDVQRYYFSLCDHVPPSHCPMRGGERIQSSLLCQRINGNHSFSVGNEREFVFGGEDGKSLVLMISNGDRCGASTTKKRTSNITMVCDPTGVIDPKKPSSYGTFNFLSEAPTCHYNFHLVSPLACPICSKDNYTQIKGDCKEDGTRSVTYVKKSDALCYGGASVPGLPADTAERCVHCTVSDYNVMWADCDESTNLQKRYITLSEAAGDCFDNGSIRDRFVASLNGAPETRPCQKSVDSRVLPYTVVIAILISLSLVCILISLQRKHSQLRQQYDRLASEHNGNPMEIQSSGGKKGGGGTGAMDGDEDENYDDRDELEANNNVLTVIDDEEANDVHPAVRHPSPSLVQSSTSINRQ